MAISGRWMPTLLVLVLSVAGTEAQCTDQELALLLSCIEPYNAKFFQAIGTGSPCDKSRISTDICSDYATIVDCVNKKSVSRTTCRPFGVGQINTKIEISCKINDFEEVCKDAPELDEGRDDRSDAAGASAHISLIVMSSFTTVFLATLM